jgi:hypothetical protein
MASKVCGTKTRNKTAGAYSGLRDHHMRERQFKRFWDVGPERNGCVRRAAVRHETTRMADARRDVWRPI